MTRNISVMTKKKIDLMCLSLFVNMYVCMYVRMYVCVYVCV